jgi:hypothetical protein
LQQKLSAYEAKIEALENGKGSNGTGDESTSGGVTGRKEPPRRNPLVNRASRPSPEPVEFRKILRRKRGQEESNGSDPVSKEGDSEK